MGQYYFPIALNDKSNTPKKFWVSHDYGNGLKLMEHSYLNNNFVNAVENFLMNNPCRLVWAGDYADDEKDKDYNLYSLCHDEKHKQKQDRDGNIEDIPHGFSVVNHSKKEFYRRDTLPSFKLTYYGGEVETMTINPLPLLTSEGNGRGGGDYWGESSSDLVGTWARDIIEVTDAIPEDYVEIFPAFAER